MPMHFVLLIMPMFIGLNGFACLDLIPEECVLSLGGGGGGFSISILPRTDNLFDHSTCSIQKPSIEQGFSFVQSVVLI